VHLIIVGVDFDPVWHRGGIMDQGEDEILYFAGLEEFNEGNYAIAENLFIEIIEDYSLGEFVHFALQELLRIERVCEDDFYDLQEYYNELDLENYQPECVPTIDYLSNYCNILNAEYNVAIQWYEDVLSNNPTMLDSIYAEIDLGYIYLLMESEGREYSARCRYHELIPENQDVYYNRKQELIDLFYGMNNLKDEEEHTNQVPTCTQLYNNYPNPFNPTTNICFDLASASRVSLNIYNIKGQKVYKLVDDYLEADKYRYQWDSINNNGRQVSSGVYFYQLRTMDYTKTCKMLLLK
jgi:tetratricopeptide (TPR) repeat protein